MDAAVRLQRSTGRVRVRLAGGRLAEAFQEGSGKLRFPAPAEALVLNTSGGLAGGDRFETAFAAEGGTLAVATVACERVYRSEGAPALVRQRLAAGAGGTLRHLPQPTILYDGAVLDRLTTVDLSEDGGLTAVEAIILGREAMGEAVRTATVRDRVEVRIAGRLAFVDALRLGTDSLARLATPAGLGTARGIGLVLHRGPDLPAALGRVRAANMAASLVGGLLVARCLAPGHTSLQDDLARVVTALDGVPPPRSWRL